MAGPCKTTQPECRLIRMVTQLLQSKATNLSQQSCRPFPQSGGKGKDSVYPRPSKGINSKSVPAISPCLGLLAWPITLFVIILHRHGKTSFAGVPNPWGKMPTQEPRRREATSPTQHQPAQLCSLAHWEVFFHDLCPAWLGSPATQHGGGQGTHIFSKQLLPSPATSGEHILRTEEKGSVIRACSQEED